MIHIFVSTMNGVFNENYFPNGEYKITILNQGRPFKNVNKRINVVNLSTVGLSRSRNEIFSLMKLDDIVVVSDNDVEFIKGFELELMKIFGENECDILTFKALDHLGNDFKPSYKSIQFFHDTFSIFKVSSIEIAFRSSCIKSSFDERFGLGAEVPLGEENIFLSDNLNKGCKILYSPVSLVKHLDRSHSGAAFDCKTTLYRFNVFTRVFGRFKGTIITLAFIIKNARKYW